MINEDLIFERRGMRAYASDSDECVVSWARRGTIKTAKTCEFWPVPEHYCFRRSRSSINPCFPIPDLLTPIWLHSPTLWTPRNVLNHV